MTTVTLVTEGSIIGLWLGISSCASDQLTSVSAQDTSISPDETKFNLLPHAMKDAVTITGTRRRRAFSHVLNSTFCVLS
jgi:hypothetical protein